MLGSEGKETERFWVEKEIGGSKIGPFSFSCLLEFWDFLLFLCTELTSFDSLLCTSDGCHLVEVVIGTTLPWLLGSWSAKWCGLLQNPGFLFSTWHHLLQSQSRNWQLGVSWSYFAKQCWHFLFVSLNHFTIVSVGCFLSWGHWQTCSWPPFFFSFVKIWPQLGTSQTSPIDNSLGAFVLPLESVWVWKE